MSETFSVCNNCPAPPENANFCGGPIIRIKGAAELNDVQASEALQAQSIGASAVERMCGAVFIPDTNTSVEEPPASGKPTIHEVKIAPGAQLWAELQAFAQDESISGAVYGCESALNDAEHLINDALRTSQYQTDVLQFCNYVRQALDDVLAVDGAFKEYVMRYLNERSSDSNPAASAPTAQSYIDWAENREWLSALDPVSSFDSIKSQLLYAINVLGAAGFTDLSYMAEARTTHFLSVAQGSNNGHIADAAQHSAFTVSAINETLEAVAGLIQKINEIAAAM